MSLEFTPSQISSLNHFFSELNVDNWDALEEDSSVWKKCIETIKQTVAEQGVNPPHIQTFSTQAINELETENVKLFLIKHLVTSLEEVEQKRIAFAKKVKINQPSFYLCFFPFSHSVMVRDEYNFAENIHLEKEGSLSLIEDLQKKSIHSEIYNEMDLCLTEAIDKHSNYSSQFLNRSNIYSRNILTFKGYYKIHFACRLNANLPGFDNIEIERIVRQRFKYYLDTCQQRMPCSSTCRIVAFTVSFVFSSILCALFNQVLRLK
jgi:hypothetical protein